MKDTEIGEDGEEDVKKVVWCDAEKQEVIEELRNCLN